MYKILIVTVFGYYAGNGAGGAAVAHSVVEFETRKLAEDALRSLSDISVPNGARTVGHRLYEETDNA